MQVLQNLLAEGNRNKWPIIIEEDWTNRNKHIAFLVGEKLLRPLRLIINSLRIH